MHHLITGKTSQYARGLEHITDPAERKKIIAERKRLARLGANDKLSRLEKIEEEQRSHKLNEEFKAFEGFEGPVKERKATDKWWTASFLVILLFLVIHGGIAISGGQPYRLYSGLDFRSRACGTDSLSTKKYLYFPLPNVDINISMCLKSCPVDTGRRLCLYYPDGISPHSGDKFCYTSVQTQVDGRYCIPREQKTKQSVDSWVNSWENVYRRAIGDLSLSLDMIILAILLEMLVLVGVLFMLSFERTVSCCFWVTTIIGINAFNFMSLFAYLEYVKTVNRRCYKGIDTNSCGGARASLFWLLTWIFVGVGLTYLLTVLFFCRKLQYVMNALKATVFFFKRMRQAKLPIFIGTLSLNTGTVFTLFFAFFMIAVLMYASSYGPDSLITSAAIAGGRLKQFIPVMAHRYVLIIYSHSHHFPPTAPTVTTLLLFYLTPGLILRWSSMLRLLIFHQAVHAQQIWVPQYYLNIL